MLITLPIDTAVLLADDLDAFNDDRGTNRQARKALIWKLRWAAKLGAKQITLEGADTTGINWVRFYEEDAEEVKKEEEEVATGVAVLHQQVAAAQEPKNGEAEKPKDDQEVVSSGEETQTTSEAEQSPEGEQPTAPKKRGRPIGWRKNSG